MESSAGPLLGGLIGTAIAPGIGTQIGAGLGGIGGGLLEINRAKSNTPEVSESDPRQLARLREIDATRRQISEGRDPLTMQRVSEIQKMGETTKGQLGKFTGGDVGGTLSAMLRAQRNTGQGINQAYSESQNRLPFFENLSSQLLNRIEQRKLDLGVHEQDRARLQQESGKQSMMNSASGLLASLGGAAINKGLTPQTSSIADLGGGGVNSVGQSSPGLATLPINLPQTFQQGLVGDKSAIAGSPYFGGFNSMGEMNPATFNVSGGFGQQLGGGFGGFGGGNSFVEGGRMLESQYTTNN